MLTNYKPAMQTVQTDYEAPRVVLAEVEPEGLSAFRARQDRDHYRMIAEIQNRSRRWTDRGDFHGVGAVGTVRS